MTVHTSIYHCLANKGWDILILLYHQNLIYSQIKYKLFIDSPTTAKNLNTLVQYGLVQRHYSRITKQELGYEITQKGRRLLNYVEGEMRNL